MHSKHLKRPQDFEGKVNNLQRIRLSIKKASLTSVSKVLSIGGGPSYIDIGKRMAPYVEGKLLVSTRTAPGPDKQYRPSSKHF